MSGVAAAIGGAAVLGYVATTNAANSAASSQTNAANNSNDMQRYMYDQSRADNTPWRQAGGTALSELSGNKFMDNFQGDPGYQFRLSEGMKAINAAGSARGNANSGATMKALTRYGQDYASNEYNNAYNRNSSWLSAIAGLGSTANSQQNATNANYAGQYGSNLMGAGNAQSAAAIASGNAAAGALNQGANSYMQYQMMNRMFPGK